MATAASINASRVKPAALARVLGVSRQAVHDLVKRKVLTVDADGLIDVELAKLAISNRVRPSGKSASSIGAPAPSRPPEGGEVPPLDVDDDEPITNYHVAKTLREAADARLAQLRLAKARREQINLQAVQDQLALDYATTREGLLQIPARLGPTLAAESDPAAVQRMLHAEIHQALSRLAGAPEAVARIDGAFD